MKKTRYLLGLLVLVLVAGCAGNQALSKTKIESATLKTYYSQAIQTKAMSERTDLTEAQKVIVRKKKALIVKADPLIKAYGKIIAGGGVPTPDQETEISNLIDELVSLSTP